jgi:hypothetical protein
MLGDALPSLPASIHARLFAAFGLELIYNKHDHQVTIYATITPATPATLADIIAISEPPATPDGLAHSPQHRRLWVECPPPHTGAGRWGMQQLLRRGCQDQAEDPIDRGDPGMAGMSFATPLVGLKPEVTVSFLSHLAP